MSIANFWPTLEKRRENLDFIVGAGYFSSEFNPGPEIADFRQICVQNCWIVDNNC
jgi:hypothetical protein